MAVPRQRILDLMKACFHLVTSDALSHQLTPPCQVQCRIFSTVFNPTHQRLGNKILRQRLKGPSLAAYYPRRTVTFRDLKTTYPGFDMYDEVEEDRLDHITMTKARGKGAPRKKRSAAESRSRKGGKKR